MLFNELSLQGLASVVIIIGIILIFIKNLRMPKQYYENREIFNSKLKDKILATPDYFGVIKAPPEELENISKNAIEESESQEQNI